MIARLSATVLSPSRRSVLCCNEYRTLSHFRRSGSGSGRSTFSQWIYNKNVVRHNASSPLSLSSPSPIPLPLLFQQVCFKSTESNASSQDPFGRKEAAKRRHEEKGSNNTGGSKITLDDGSKQDAKDDPRKQAVDEKKDAQQFQAARLPIVLCHGFFGFDTLGTNPGLSIDYWYGVREALTEIGCVVHTAKVPPFAAIEKRAAELTKYLERTVPQGSEVNMIGHSMGGLDCRYLISQLKSRHFKVKSLTTLGTPHRGSSFADYIMYDLVGRNRLEAFWTVLGAVGLERGAAENLTVEYLQNEFNPKTPDDPDVAYFSYGASFNPGLFSRFRFSWKVLMDREGPNDGLVSVQSAKWGKYIKTIPNADHMDLMNWVNALAWSRARFPWIVGGSSHDPEGRPKGAFETDNDDEEDKDQPSEEPPLFNAIELYLEISDMLYRHGL
ncbi:Alpha/Beta hydrolase protein [Lobosporangium transversale]|uniref:GPI inositol-deacylase n=1 Tax=Lobosporangium transversale TaxID=64571 RepID=A0A1Y2H4H5_9FUNG|nr:Alpha/Beta hydrolase protein [Lobosporangium transversale]ORZ28891.1 Alpha/Beta hydrolase protein [Lobosporangium transversale]|eukprot:XP_021886564.1 Alpha/Beta hydrolase protein [Lobosporangium transversale]